ncbi:MAG: YebC/PmpR family DNA-binding transcriptional regulator [Chloroflexi bacterium]|nr:YebC/PmpR family DNA-binding transcriptional regulator [Chloroflexota bacterium]
MSGHSKWAQIKRSKGVADAKRGQLFTRLAREIIIAVKQGGGPNPEGNARLRLAIQKARDSNMPLDNIDRAIKRASGAGEGAALQEFVVEGYGPNGVAIMVQAVSDNRNRTIGEVRNAFVRGGGNMAESGAVSWMFENHGVITIQPDGIDADELALMAIDAGAEDVKTDKNYVEIQTRPKDLEAVRKSLEQKNIKVSSAEVVMIPKTVVNLEDEAALKTLKLLERLEELDDVQQVYSNADFSDAVLEQMHSGKA